MITSKLKNILNISLCASLILSSFSTQVLAETLEPRDLMGWEVNTELYDLVATWKTPPSILVCEDTNFDYYNIVWAVSHWENQGYEFGDIIKENDNLKCQDKPIFGFVQIQGVGLEINVDEAYAITRNTTYFDFESQEKVMWGTIIESSEDSTEFLEVVVHEIGHALGFLHASHKDRNDIMNLYHLYN